MESIEIKINHGLIEHNDGDVVKVEVHPGTKIPIENFWRRRLRDAAIDGCCEIVEPVKKSRRKKSDEDGGEE